MRAMDGYAIDARAGAPPGADLLVDGNRLDDDLSVEMESTIDPISPAGYSEPGVRYGTRRLWLVRKGPAGWVRIARLADDTELKLRL